MSNTGVAPEKWNSVRNATLAKRLRRRDLPLVGLGFV